MVGDRRHEGRILLALVTHKLADNGVQLSGVLHESEEVARGSILSAKGNAPTPTPKQRLQDGGKKMPVPDNLFVTDLRHYLIDTPLLTIPSTRGCTVPSTSNVLGESTSKEIVGLRVLEKWRKTVLRTPVLWCASTSHAVRKCAVGAVHGIVRNRVGQEINFGISARVLPRISDISTAI